MLKLTLALSCLLISCQAGFWSNGVGAVLPPMPRCWAKIATLLPVPGGAFVQDLGLSDG